MAVDKQSKVHASVQTHTYVSITAASPYGLCLGDLRELVRQCEGMLDEAGVGVRELRKKSEDRGSWWAQSVDVTHIA
jgi:hypothetical protein